MLIGRPPVASRPTRALEQFPLQLAIAWLAGVGAPMLSLLTVFHMPNLAVEGVRNSIVAASGAVILATYLLRRVSSFPGVRAFRYVLPSYASAFGLAVAGMVALRLEYNRPFLLSSLVLSLLAAMLLSLYLQRRATRRYYLVPFGKTDLALETPDVDWIVMTRPEVPLEDAAVIVADLRHDHEDAWERMLADAAIRGHAVYHTKVLRESLTGRVSIEHLSENSFGSLLPNLAYARAKRTVDVLATLVMLPLIALPMLAIALAIRMEGGGPILFRQMRMGYRGEIFEMLKFRTMTDTARCAGSDGRDAAITAAGDQRITRLGRLLRRTRVDELPQFFNILRGDMSWIGPRPEAIALSRWYETEIPFYNYRHIVRPGISGWAQVSQGHVADLAAVTAKLSYDFYYIKNFSLWLDALIVLKTVKTMLSGFGAR